MDAPSQPAPSASRRRIALAAGTVALAVVVAGGTWWTLRPDGAEPAPASAPRLGEAGAFIRRIVSQLVANEYGRVWPTLHPAHQRVAPRAEYVGCERASAIPEELDSVVVLRVSDRTVRVAGVAQPVAAKAVVVRITLVPAGENEPTVLEPTVHAVAVEGRWRWILPPERYELYRTDGCAGSPTTG